MKTPDYMSYSRYKNKKNEEPQKGLWIGITTFFVMLLLFTAIAKVLSPDVDVTIHDDEDIEAKESGLGVKRFIDDRLKMIQMEDGQTALQVEEKHKPKDPNLNMEGEYSPELDERVVIPKHAQEESLEEGIPQAVSPQNAPRPGSAKTTATPRATKVYVGYYSNAEQAKVAQGILMDSGLNITPFIKDLGGTYTLQVGSYSSRDKAIGVSNELLRNNFPARVVQD